VHFAGFQGGGATQRTKNPLSKKKRRGLKHDGSSYSTAKIQLASPDIDTVFPLITFSIYMLDSVWFAQSSKRRVRRTTSCVLYTRALRTPTGCNQLRCELSEQSPKGSAAFCSVPSRNRTKRSRNFKNSYRRPCPHPYSCFRSLAARTGVYTFLWYSSSSVSEPQLTSFASTAFVKWSCID
jgi:hypothetical protein